MDPAVHLPEYVTIKEELIVEEDNVQKVKEECEKKFCYEIKIKEEMELPHSSGEQIGNLEIGRDETDNDSTIERKSAFQLDYEQKLRECYDSLGKSERNVKRSWTSNRIFEVMENIKKIRMSSQRESLDYYWISKYDIMETSGEDILIFKKKTDSDPTVRIIPMEKYFDILTEVHLAVGHRGRDKMMFHIKNKLYIPKKAVEIYIQMCSLCKMKRSSHKKAIVASPVAPMDYNSIGQVDLIDFRSAPHGEHKWLMKYQDQATKFLHLRPLKSDRANEVASELMKIFLQFLAPLVLQSEKGREFAASVIGELVKLWPECTTIRPQAQGSVERCEQDIESTLHRWMQDNESTNWAARCYVIQYCRNTSFHPAIGRSPYSALFGSDPKTILKITDIVTDSLNKTEDEIASVECNGHCAETPKLEKSETATVANVLAIDQICTVCGSGTTGDRSCRSCSKPVHADCGVFKDDESHESYIVCFVCNNEQTQRGVKRPAESTTDGPTKKLPSLKIGDSVFLNIPKADHSLDTKIIRGKIIDSKNGLFKIGTNSGTIQDWLPPQDLHISFMDYDGAISESLISLRQAFTDQFVDTCLQKCTCKTAKNQCITKRCACFKNNALCNSKCHQSLSCINK